MAGNYTPSHEAANSSYVWDIAQLSTRDIARNIPINFITWPGIRLNTACFPDNVFTTAKGTCISNILAVGYRRIVVDLYWDGVNGGKWVLCPVVSPSGDSDTSQSTRSSSAKPSSTSSRSTISQSSTTSISRTSSLPSISSATIIRRDESAISNSMLASPPPVSTSTALPADTGPAETIGAYSCDPDYNLDYFFGLLRSMLQNTSTNLGSHMSFVILDLHIARGSTSDQVDSVQPGSALNDYINKYINDYTYSPNDLASDRSNLNESWAITTTIPTHFYSLYTTDGGNLATRDGWPTEYYLLTTGYAKRMMLSFGTIDIGPNATYDVKADYDKIFPPDTMSMEFDNANRCIVNNQNATVANFNTSWNTYENPSNTPLTNTSASAFINCGTSYIVNQTLGGVIADNVTPYLDFLQQTQWSWDVLEPANYSDPPKTGNDTRGKSIPVDNDDPDSSQWHCGYMQNTGRWAVTYCNLHLHVACRVGHEPYQWTISKDTASYYDAEHSCPDGEAFGVPRTSLQNHFLFLQMLNVSQQYIWIDINDFDVDGCWVSGGPNATCDYNINARDAKTVIVPSVAAIVALILFVFFAMIKLASYRIDKSRKRRRKEWKKFAGYDYEGVPS